MDQLERALADEVDGGDVEDLGDAVVGEGDRPELVLVDPPGPRHHRSASGDHRRQDGVTVADDHADHDAVAVAQVEDVTHPRTGVGEHDRRARRPDGLRPHPGVDETDAGTGTDELERRADLDEALPGEADRGRERHQPPEVVERGDRGARVLPQQRLEQRHAGVVVEDLRRVVGAGHRRSSSNAVRGRITSHLTVSTWKHRRGLERRRREVSGTTSGDRRRGGGCRRPGSGREVGLVAAGRWRRDRRAAPSPPGARAP